MSEAQMSQINTNRSSVFIRGFIVVQFTQTKILSSYLRTTCTWARAEINSHFAAGPQARWRGASDELYRGGTSGNKADARPPPKFFSTLADAATSSGDPALSCLRSCRRISSSARSSRRSSSPCAPPCVCSSWSSPLSPSLRCWFRSCLLPSRG